MRIKKENLKYELSYDLPSVAQKRILLRAWDKTNKCWIKEFGITSKGEYLCWDNGYVVIPGGHRQKNIDIYIELG